VLSFCDQIFNTSYIWQDQVLIWLLEPIFLSEPNTSEMITLRAPFSPSGPWLRYASRMVLTAWAAWQLPATVRRRQKIFLESGGNVASWYLLSAQRGAGWRQRSGLTDTKRARRYSEFLDKLSSLISPAVSSNSSNLSSSSFHYFQFKDFCRVIISWFLG